MSPPPSATDVVRAFLDEATKSKSGAVLPLAALHRVYAAWCRRERTAPFSAPALASVVGILTDQRAAGIEAAGLRGRVLTDPVAAFLLAETKPSPDGAISTGALYRAFTDWWTEGRLRALTPNAFRARAAALLNQDLTRVEGAHGPVLLWTGIVLDDGLPEDAVAPGDPTDAGELRAAVLEVA
jgi:hypothetical protein